LGYDLKPDNVVAAVEAVRDHERADEQLPP
jgi:hypothetical protein